MVKIWLKNGEAVDVPGGVAGFFSKETVKETKETPTEVGTTLEIRSDTSSYKGIVLAVFKSEEVLGFIVVDEPPAEE